MLVHPLRAHDAEACSCSRNTLTEPRDGATDVPLDAKILVYQAVPSPPDPGYELRSASGEVPTSLEQVAWGSARACRC